MSGEAGLELRAGVEVAGYVVEGRIASGSFGTVYRARQGGRPFALKLVPLGPRADRELDALRRAQAPGVVGFRGCGFWPDDTPRFLVLALERVEGRSLEDWAQEENPSALVLVRQVLLPLARTLVAVHAAGVVHRDIKEANIVIREADGLPVLVDFGAAAYQGAPSLTVMLPPGTPEYRSPEAWRFAREGTASGPYPARPEDDLWALGVSMYRLLTRAFPFGDRHSPSMVLNVLEHQPRPPRELNPQVPQALSDLCMRMLEKGAEARYPSAEALEAALREMEAQATETWRLPLFPHGLRTRTRMTTDRNRLERWRLWSAVGGAVLALGMLLAAPWRSASVPASPVSQPVASNASPLMQQADAGQELAPSGRTAEVVSGAGPMKSLPPAPAPVARATPSEDSSMKKSQKTRALLAAGCLAGSACASSPMSRPLPPSEECPPGYFETLERFDLGLNGAWPAYPPGKWPSRFPKLVVSEGDITLTIMGPWGDGPKGALFHGKLYFGKGRVYGRFTRVQLPGGEVAPICMDLALPEGIGIKIDANSTPKKTIISNIFTLRTVDRFE
jgi:serine/threonine-protein kinase